MLKEHKRSCQTAENICTICKGILTKESVKLVSVGRVTVDLKLKKRKGKSIESKERMLF